MDSGATDRARTPARAAYLLAASTRRRRALVELSHAKHTGKNQSYRLTPHGEAPPTMGIAVSNATNSEQQRQQPGAPPLALSLPRPKCVRSSSPRSCAAYSQAHQTPKTRARRWHAGPGLWGPASVCGVWEKQGAAATRPSTTSLRLANTYRTRDAYSAVRPAAPSARMLGD